MPAKLKTPPLKTLVAKVMHESVGIVIPCYDATGNNNLARVQYGIEQCADLPYQLSMGIGPNCVAKNRKKGEARLGSAIRFVIHMDDDVLVPPHFASQLLSVLISQDNVGLVSATMIGPRGEAQNDLHPDRVPVGKVVECQPPGTFFAYDRLKTPIEWDERYLGSQWEDTDAMRQVQAQGYRTVATGNVTIMHLNNWSENKWWNQNRELFESKWGKP